MTGIDIERGEPEPSDPPDPGTGADDASADTADAEVGTAVNDDAATGVGDTTEYRLHAAAAEPAPNDRRRGRKVSKWDRRPPPRDWRWWVGGLGKTLITVGILMFAFVAYQLWGTGIENAAAQRALEDDFEELLAQFEPIEPVDGTETTDQPDASSTGDDALGGIDPENATPDEPATGDDAPPADADAGDDPTVPLEQEPPVIDPVEVVPVVDQNLPPVEDGDAIARIEIPRIGLNDIVVAGVAVGDLKRGPGHFPDTPLPGQLGNAAIAGHRTTYGAPFFDIDQLEPGDEIIITTLNGRFVYRVTGDEIVPPSAYGVVATTDPTRSTLTLVSCHPRYTARQRIITYAELDTTASGPVGEPVLNYGRPPELPELVEPDTEADNADETPAADDGANVAAEDDADVAAEDGSEETTSSDEAAPSDAENGSTTGDLPAEPATPADLLLVNPAATSADVFSKGWFSDPAANAHVGFWGLVLVAIASLAYLLSRTVRRDWVGLVVGIVPFVVALYFFFQNVNRLLPPNL